MRSKDTIRVSFEIFDFGNDPADLTKSLGIEPSSISRKGEEKLVGPSERPARVKVVQNMWSLDSELDASEGVERHVDALLAKLMPHRQEIKKITEAASARFRCTLLLEDPRPGISFSPEQSKQMADLNAVLDLDIYFTGKND